MIDEMNKETKELLDRMKRVIDSSEKKHKQVANRYLCLANRKIRGDMDRGKFKGHLWGVIGASMGLEKRWEAKFGIFFNLSEGVFDRF